MSAGEVAAGEVAAGEVAAGELEEVKAFMVVSGVRGLGVKSGDLEALRGFDSQVCRAACFRE
jgi:hypothetical protein